MLDIARPQHLKLLFKFPVSLVFYCTLVSWAVRFLCCAVYVCVCLVDTKAGCCFEEQKVCKWAKQKKKNHISTATISGVVCRTNLPTTQEEGRHVAS